MAPYRDDDDEDDREDGLDEGPGAHDAHLLDDDEEEALASETVPCPHCGEEILADADLCHHCGEYFGREAWLVQRSPGQAVWAVVAVAVVIAMLWFLLR